jgi:hypothetical protein
VQRICGQLYEERSDDTINTTSPNKKYGAVAGYILISYGFFQDISSSKQPSISLSVVKIEIITNLKFIF